jgi:hypothetical protein
LAPSAVVKASLRRLLPFSKSAEALLGMRN